MGSSYWQKAGVCKRKREFTQHLCCISDEKWCHLCQLTCRFFSLFLQMLHILTYLRIDMTYNVCVLWNCACFDYSIITILAVTILVLGYWSLKYLNPCLSELTKVGNFHEFHYNLQDGGHLVMWSVFQPPVCYLFSSH